MKTLIMNTRKTILVILGILACTHGQASNNQIFNVLACEPEWAALAYALLTEENDDSFKIYSATTAAQDPHHIQARPSLIAKARKADLLICSGAELEAGWLPILLRKSSNPNIQPSASTHFIASDHVELIGKRNHVDRSEGDVHAAGNPHVHFDPHRMLVIANALSDLLIKSLPGKKMIIENNLKFFTEEMNNTLIELNKGLLNVQGKKFVVQHNNWAYLFEWLNISKVAELEPKPGLPPTASHLISLLDSVNKETTDLIIYSSYQDDKAAKWMSKKTGIKKLQIPYSVEKWDEKTALHDFYSGIISSINANINSFGK